MPVDRAELPLGVFDSGLGGLTVVRALRRVLPAERVLYLGDTARVPYGTRSSETILRYARGCAELLVRRGIKALVVACNTASAVAVEMLRAELDLPVIGVIEPGAGAAVALADRASAQLGRSVRIGVLGTTRTVQSGAYPRAVATLTGRYEVVASAAPLLVPLVEEGWLEGEVPRLAAERYLAPLIEAEVGVIVLGCTHYPLLGPLIESAAERLAGRRLLIVDSADATAEALRQLLSARGLSRRGAALPDREALELLVSDVPAGFSVLAARFLGHEATAAVQVDL